jgi:hypothetical protein
VAEPRVGAAPERWRGSGENCCREEVGQEAAKGCGRPQGDADADQRQETGEGGCGEEAGGEALANRRFPQRNASS